MDNKSILVIGANGQLGKALRLVYPGARAVDSDELDITNRDKLAKFDLTSTKYIINAAAYTNVDEAETEKGRKLAWMVNAAAPLNLIEAASKSGITLVHISSDYVFDGSIDDHKEDEMYSPLSVYGASKAAGDIVVSSYPNHYIVRTSWVVGDGKNFVRAMLNLGGKGTSPSVVSDQIGRPTFTNELALAIDHLLNKKAVFGIYNMSNSGRSASWADIARKVFDVAGLDVRVTDVTTNAYYKDKRNIAPRPKNSNLDLSKLIRTGFMPNDWEKSIVEYIEKELNA